MIIRGIPVLCRFERASGNQKDRGAYATIGDFNYDYQPGSGEQVVPMTPIHPMGAKAEVLSIVVGAH